VATQPSQETPAGEMTAAHPRTVTMPHTGSRPVRFLKQLGTAALDDNLLDIGAMMAYYVVLALFPMLVFIVTVGLLVVDPATVHEGVLMATHAMPESVRTMVATQVSNLIDAADAGFAIFGALFALWGASRGAAALSGALNTIFDRAETRSYWKRQVIAIGVTFGVALLVLVALGLLVAGPIVGHYVADRFGLGDAFDVGWGLGRWGGAGVLVMIVWAILYRFIPDTDEPFRVFTPGALVGVLLWIGISLAFGFYLENFASYDATYGALGGAIIFLTWLWLSNLALLFGAELNHVLAAFRSPRRDL